MALAAHNLADPSTSDGSPLRALDAVLPGAETVDWVTSSHAESRSDDRPRPVNGRTRVLVIEDDPDDVRLLEGYLADENEGGVEIVHHLRLADGLAHLAEHGADLVLLDLMLPDAMGLDTFRQLRHNSPAVPVVVMTGCESDAQAIEAVREGAEDYLFKGQLSGHLLVRTIRYAVERARSRALEQEFRSTQRELAIAREIQQALYPESVPDLPGYDIAGASFPASHVGGDYYDFLHLHDEYLGIAIGDASGHGIGAALVSSETRAMLRSLVISHHSADEIVTLANRVLSEGIRESHFMTLFLARFNPRTGSFVYTSAGHEPGYVFDSGGRLKTELRSTGIPLGVLGDCEFPNSVGLTLGPGETVVLVTDGVREARTHSLNLFGRQPLLELIEANLHRPARAIIEAIETAVRGHCADGGPLDDFTVVVIKVDPDAELSPYPAWLHHAR